MKLMTRAAAVLAAFGERTLACPAEFGEQLSIPGFAAAADLTAFQYLAVRASAANAVNLCSEVAGVSGAAKMPIGILQNKPNTNEAAIVSVLGMSKWKAGGTVTVNGLITHNSSGRCVDAVSGDIVLGRALEGTTVDGAIITALILPPVRWPSVA
jgi:hypothetical protein